MVDNVHYGDYEEKDDNAGDGDANEEIEIIVRSQHCGKFNGFTI